MEDRKKGFIASTNNAVAREELLSVPDLDLTACIKHPTLVLGSKVTHHEILVHCPYNSARPAPS